MSLKGAIFTAICDASSFPFLEGISCLNISSQIVEHSLIEAKVSGNSEI